MGFKSYVLSWHEILSADFRLNFPAFDQLCSSFIRTPLSLITPFRLSCCWFVGLHRSNHVTFFVFSVFLLILPSNRLVDSTQFEYEWLRGLVTINHI